MSATISAAEVKKLRQATGAGMMDCRKALMENDGDFEKAIDFLRKKGQKVANKRSDREAKEGVVIALANDVGNYGVDVRISSETDFVAKNEEFVEFAKNVAKIALNNKPDNIEALKKLPMGDVTVGDKIVEMVGKIGEKIDIAGYEQISADAVIPYIHGNYRIGVLVGLNKTANDNISTAGKDVAMQIAAMNPIAVDENQVSQETIDREKEVAMGQIKAEGKPEELAERIAVGKLKKFFKENTLLNQVFVKDNKATVKDYLNKTENGLTVTEYRRLAVG